MNLKTEKNQLATPVIPANDLTNEVIKSGTFDRNEAFLNAQNSLTGDTPRNVPRKTPDLYPNERGFPTGNPRGNQPTLTIPSEPLIPNPTAPTTNHSNPEQLEKKPSSERGNVW